MTLPKYCELNTFKTIVTIDQEILRLRKVLLELRLKIFLAEVNAVHLIAHTKRRIAQLSFKKGAIMKANFHAPR